MLPEPNDRILTSVRKGAVRLGIVCGSLALATGLAPLADADPGTADPHARPAGPEFAPIPRIAASPLIDTADERGGDNYRAPAPATPLVLRAADDFDRPDGPLGPNWITWGGGTLKIVNGHLDGRGTPSTPLSLAFWSEPMPSETQVMRCVVRWNGREPEHSSIGPVVRANPGVDTGVQFAFTDSIMALYHEDPANPNGFTPVAGTPQYASTSRFPEGAVIELRAEGDLYTARVNGKIVLQGTVGADKIPFTNRYVGTVIQDDSRERGGGQPPAQLDDCRALTP